MDNTSFTIIMPVYNTRKEYLEFAINSIFNLNYDNYELIIVDDGSNQETKNNLAKFKDRARIIERTNGGISKARITAFPYIKNDYVLFMDSDDYIAKNALKLLDSIITEYKSDIVLYDFARFKNNDIDGFYNKRQFLKEGVQRKEDILQQLCQLHINSLCSKVVNRKLLKNLEKNIDTSIVNGEDLQQSTYLILKAESYYYTENIIELYRVLDEQRSYYNIYNIIRDINWLLRPLVMLKENRIEEKMLNTFYIAAVNNIIFNGFRICVLAKNKEERNALLNEVLLSRIVKKINQETKKLPLHLSVLFKLLINKNFSLFATAALIYDRLTGIQRI